MTGKVWVLSQLVGKSPLSNTSITAVFTSNGTVSGSAGCNRYNGTYQTSGNHITFPTPMATTMMMCDPGVMAQENAYLQSLAQVKTFTISGEELTLLGDNRTPLTVYQAQSQDLSGTSWSVTAYNNGKQAVTSVINGTTLTADFGKDGNLTGSSGCNTYQGSYKISGNQISIGSLTSTMMACNTPQGIMEQETQYLAALQSAVTYRVEGSSMELRTTEGALAVNLLMK